MTHFGHCLLLGLQVVSIIAGVFAVFSAFIILHLWGFTERKWFRWFLLPLDFLVLVLFAAMVCFITAK